MEYQEILRKIATAYTKILQDNLAGIYVHGSIAFGCFHWSKSDIDFLVVVQTEPGLAEKRALIQTLLDLDKAGPNGFNRLLSGNERNGCRSGRSFYRHPRRGDSPLRPSDRNRIRTRTKEILLGKHIRGY